jgi:hypothetical protein
LAAGLGRATRQGVTCALEPSAQMTELPARRITRRVGTLLSLRPFRRPGGPLLQRCVDRSRRPVLPGQGRRITLASGVKPWNRERRTGLRRELACGELPETLFDAENRMIGATIAAIVRGTFTISVL